VGRPAIITREKVAQTALRLIDEEGLEAVSLERIANELNVRGPSLYHHFSDKAAILTEVAKLVLGDLDLDRPADDWVEWMIETSLTFYRRVLEHPRAAAILLQFMPDSSALPGFARAAEMLTKAGVDPSLQVMLMEGCEKLAWGWSLQRAVTAQTGERLSPAKINKRWPELAEAIRHSRWKDEDLLEESLRAFISGVLERAEMPSKSTRTPAAAKATRQSRNGIRRAAV
jgi:TetR/AcrR family transcriptional regulator, tetracycline repressor protein